MKVGVALGGGGVRGLAHVPVLQVLDDLGIRPAVIAGTSMGAIIGALYASGLSATEIREGVGRHVILKDDKWRDVIEKKDDLLKWISAFKKSLTRAGLINAQGLLQHLFNEIKVSRFEDLEIPLLLVATDFWTAEQVVFEKGDLMPAVQASMAVPGVFAPVAIDGRVLIDGGVVNLVPYDLVMERSDFTIAVNVSRIRAPGRHDVPNALEAVLGAFDIMQSTALSERMKVRKPDVYLWPQISDVRMLDFGKIEEVFAQGAATAEALRAALSETLGKNRLG
jgi:NTE family protein